MDDKTEDALTAASLSRIQINQVKPNRLLGEIIQDLSKRVPEHLLSKVPPKWFEAQKEARDREARECRKRHYPLDLLPYDVPHKYIPWYNAVRVLNHYAPGWIGEIRNIAVPGKTTNTFVTVVYRITLKGSDGEVCREASATSTMDYSDHSVYFSPVQNAERSHRRNGSLDNTGSDDDVSTEDIDDTVSVESGSSKSSASVEIGYRAPDLVMRWNEEASDEFDYHLRSERYNLGRAKRRKVRHPKSVESLENNNEVSDEDGSGYELFGQLENIESILHSSISSQMQPSTFNPLKTLQMPFVQPLSPGDTWVPSTFPRLTPSQLTAHAKHCKKLKQVVQSLKSKHAINASKKEKKIKDQMTYASTLLNTTSGTLCLESSGVISSNLDSKEAMLAPSTKFIAEEALFDSDEGDMRGSKKTKAETARQTRSLRVVAKVGEHSHLLFMEKRRKKEALEFQNVENMPSSSGPVQRNTKANISKVKTTRHKNRQSMKDRKFKISNQQRSGNRFLLENEYETVDELILSSEASDTGLETNVLGLKGDKSRKQKIMHRQETAHHTEDNAQNNIKKEKRKVFVDDEDYHSARDSTPSSRGSEIEPESIQKSFVTRVQHDAEVLGDIEFIDGSLETAGIMIGKEEEIVRGFLIEKAKLQSKSSKMVRSTQKKKVQPHIKGPKGNKARHPKSNFLSESSRKPSSPADKPLETEIILPTSDTMISIQVESYEDKSRFKVQQSTQVNESSLRTIVPKLRSVQSTKLKRSAIDNKDKSSLKSTSSEVKRVIRADATTRNLEMGKKRMNRMHKEASRRVVIAPYEKKISFLNPISESLGELTTLAYHDEYTSENWKDVDSRMERKFQEGEREHVVESQWRAKQKRMARLAAVSRKKESFSNIKNKSPQKLETTREDTKKYERHQLPRGRSKQKVMKKLAISHNSEFVDEAPSLSEDPEAYQKDMQPSKQLQILKPKVIRALQSYGEIEMASHERKTVLTNDLSSIIQESSTSSIEGYETDADEPLRKIPKRYISQDGMQLLEKAGTSRETVINKIQDATPLYSVSKVAGYSFENHETAIASSSKNSMLIKSRRRKGTQLHEKICEPMNSVLHKENMKLSVHDGLEISEELTIDQRRDGSAKMEDSKIERSKQEADECLKLSESEKIILQKEGKMSVTDHTLDKGKSTQEKIDKSLMKTPQLHKLSSYEQGSKSSLASDLHIGTYLDRKSNDEVHATKRHSKEIRKIKKMQDHQFIAKGSTSSNENETFATSLDVKMSISRQEQEGSILMKTLKLGGHSQEQGDYIVVDSFETDRESRYYGKESKREVDKIREISTVETDMTSEHKSTDPENQIKILAHKSMFVGEILPFSEDFGAKVDAISELGSSTAIMESSKIGQFSIDVLAPKREKKEDINVISLSDEQLDTDKTNISSREETEIKEDAILQGMNHEDIIQMERCLVIARDNITNDMSSSEFETETKELNSLNRLRENIEEKGNVGFESMEDETKLKKESESFAEDTPSTSSAKAGDLSKDESSSFKADIIESVKHDTSKSDMDGGPITSSTMDVRIVTSTSTFSSEYASCAAEIFPPMNENKETSQKQKIRRNSEISFGNEPSFSLKASTTEEKAIASPTVDARTIKAVSNLSSQISTPGAKVYLPDNATPEYDQMKEILKSPEISIVYGPSSTVRSWNLEKEPVIAGGTVETSITTIVETDMGQVIATINDQSHQGETFEVDNDETRFFNSTKNKRTVDSEMRFTSNFTTSVPICHSREGEYQPFDEKEIVSDPKVSTMDEFSVSSQSYITEMPLKSEVDDDEQRVIVSSSESSSHFATPVGEVHSPWDASSESDHMEGALKTSQLLTVDQPSTDLRNSIMEGVMPLTSEEEVDNRHFIDLAMDMSTTPSSSTSSSPKITIARIIPPIDGSLESDEVKEVRRVSKISTKDKSYPRMEDSTTGGLMSWTSEMEYDNRQVTDSMIDASISTPLSTFSHPKVEDTVAKVIPVTNSSLESDTKNDIRISKVFTKDESYPSMDINISSLLIPWTSEVEVINTNMDMSTIASVSIFSHPKLTATVTEVIPMRGSSMESAEMKEIEIVSKVFTTDESYPSVDNSISSWLMPQTYEVEVIDTNMDVNTSTSTLPFSHTKLATFVTKIIPMGDGSLESDKMKEAERMSEISTEDESFLSAEGSTTGGISGSSKVIIDSTIDMKTIALESISEPRFSNAVTKFDQAESCGLGCEIIMVKHETHGIYSSLRNNMDTGVTSRSARGEDDGKRETISMISMGSVALATTSTSNSVRSSKQAPKSQESSPEKKIESVSRFHTMQKVPTGLKRSSIAKAAVRTLRLESDIGQGRTMDMKTNLTGTTSTQNIASPTPKVHQVRTSVASKVRPWSVGGETTVRRRSPILDKYSTERQRSNSSPKKSVARVLKSHHKYDSSFSLKKQTSGRSTGWTKERVTKLAMSNETNETTTTSSLKSHSHRKKDDLQISLDQESGCEKTVIKSSEITLIHGASSSKKNSFARRVKPWPKNEMVKVPRYKTYDRGVPLSRSEIETECGASLDSVPSGQMPAEMLGYDSSGLRKLTPLTLGLETEGGVMTIIIPRNSSLPIRRRQLISTHIDNQTELLLHIFEGERFWVRDNEMLGSFEIKEIVPAPRGEPLITVRFDIDTKGILNVFVEGEKTVGRRTMKALAISNVSVRPNREKILEMILDAKNHKVEDDENRRRIEVKDTLENYVYKMRNIINDERIARFLDPRDKKEMMTAVNDALNWVRKSNWVLYDQKQIAEFHEVDAQRRKVQSICNPILERLFLGESHVRNIQNLPPTDH